MHLRLVSPHPTPAVYLSLAFPFNASHLPLPPNWASSAQRLANDDLEIPNAVHFLDKSTWIISILDQVIFDLSSLTITCHFIDGTKEEWPLVAMDCVRALENVVADVNSALSAEARRKAPSAVPQSTTPPPPPTQSPTRPKHKKSRSFFAPFVTIVSGIVTTISLSSPIKEFTFGPKITSPSPPPAASQMPEESHTPVVRSECIRRRARGRFVDIYRSWILPELKRRSNFSDYYSWILRSLLERNKAHLSFLLEQIGAPAPPTEDDYLLSHARNLLPPSRESSAGTEDEGDGLSIAATTDTDGSSIHTPTEGVSLYRNSYLNTEFPRSPSPQEFTPEDLELYHSLSQEGDRLRQLIYQNDLFESRITSDEAQLHSMLEVKSRRRAWSNREFCGGAPMALVGLATPFKSSPLARCEPITPEVASPWTPGHNSRDSSHYLCVTSGTHDLSELFPEVEEDYEEEDGQTLAEYQSPMVVDLEMGLPIPVTRAPALRMKSRASEPKVTVRDPLNADGDFLPFHHSSLEPLSSPPSLYPARSSKALTDNTGQELPLTMEYPPQYSEEDVVQPFQSGWNSSSPTIVMGCR